MRWRSKRCSHCPEARGGHGPWRQWRERARSRLSFGAYYGDGVDADTVVSAPRVHALPLQAVVTRTDFEVARASFQGRRALTRGEGTGHIQP